MAVALRNEARVKTSMHALSELERLKNPLRIFPKHLHLFTILSDRRRAVQSDEVFLQVTHCCHE